MSTPSTFPPRSQAVFACAILFLGYTFAFVDRNIVALLVVPIVAACGLTMPKTSSRAITSLLTRKLITRDAMPGNRRQARLSLTTAGQAVHDELFPQVKALNQELLAGLSAEAVDGLDQALADMQRRAEALVATRTDVPRTYRLRGGRHVD